MNRKYSDLAPASGTRRDPSRQSLRQRGFIHVLLLVFAVLGLTMWGVAEVVFRITEGDNRITEKEQGALNQGRRALLDYALNAPPRLQFHNRVGRYAAITDTFGRTPPANFDELNIPYRYFSLPCPDLAADDNFDGIPDSNVHCGIATGTGAGEYVPLGAGSLAGRFPWRSYSGPVDGGGGSDFYQYVYGAGGQDLRDGLGDRLWYVSALNMARVDRPLNLHWQLREPGGWLRLEEVADATPGVLCSNADCSTAGTAGVGDVGDGFGRVAAVVVSPGYGTGFNTGSVSRVPEADDGFFEFTGGRTGASYIAAGGYRAYLEAPFWSDLAGVNNAISGAGRTGGAVSADLDRDLSPRIVFQRFPEEKSVDTLSYLTIDELAAAADDMFENENAGLLDVLEGRNNNPGIRQLMRAHFERFGSMPAPASFGAQSALSLERRAGGPQTPVAGTVVDDRYPPVAQIARTGADVVTITALLPVRNLHRVFLQPGAHLGAQSDGLSRTSLPYNHALYRMDTNLNFEPMPDAVRTSLIAADFYPHGALFGFRDTSTSFALDSASVMEIQNTLAPLESRVYISSRPTMQMGSFASVQQIAGGLELPIALAEPALAYLLGDDLQNRVSVGTGNLPNDIPAFGVQVQLPVGTQLEVMGDPQHPATLVMVGSVGITNADFDPLTNLWVLNRQFPHPVLFHDRSDRFVTVRTVLDNLPVQSSDTGFLPVDNIGFTNYDTQWQMVLGNATVLALAGSDQLLTQSGGTRLPSADQAVSRLASDLQLFTRARLILTPFPPAGRPFAFEAGIATLNLGYTQDLLDNIPVPSPAFINYNGPLLTSHAEFTLPAGAQIYYPPGAAIALGADFTFPQGTRALLPRGTRITVEMLQDSTLPGGASSGLAALSVLEITLHNGGAMELFGSAADLASTVAGAVVTEGARVVLDDNAGFNSLQESFDIEVSSPYHMIDATGVTVATHDGGHVLYPLTGRGRTQSAPISLVADGAGLLGEALTATVIQLTSWTRARFLTRPRDIPAFSQADTAIIRRADDWNLSVSPPTFGTLSMDINIPLVIPNTELAGAATLTVTLVGFAEDTFGTDISVVEFRVDEQTEFLIPPGEHNPALWFTRTDFTSSQGTRSLVQEFVLPAGTGVYDPEIPSFDGFTVGVNRGYAVLALPVTLTITHIQDTLGLEDPSHELFGATLIALPDSSNAPVADQLVLLPDSDVQIEGEYTIPAGSIIDVQQGVAWPPGAVRTMPEVAEDMQAISGGHIYMYFPEGVVLAVRPSLVVRSAVEYAPLHPVYETVADSRPLRGDFLGTGGRVIAPNIGVSYATFPEVFDATPSADTIEANANGVFEDGLELPAGTFIVVPGGSTLNFLSANKHPTLAVIGPDNADHMFLPEDAVAILPAGAAVTLSTMVPQPGTVSATPTTQVLGGAADGPVYLRLGGQTSPGFAIVAHADMLPASPIIHYEEDIHLQYVLLREEHYQRLGVGQPAGGIDDLFVRVAGGAYGDIFGNITRRDGYDFGTNFLPADTAEVLRNHPLIYAVAPECRARYGVGNASDCAEDENEGLLFQVETGELIELEHDMVPPGNLFVSVVAPNAANVAMDIVSAPLQDFYRGMVRASFGADALHVRGGSGGVTFSGLPTGLPVASLPGVGDVVVVSPSVDAPEGSRVRVFMNITPNAIADVDPPDLENVHYVDLPGLTVHVGGYTGDNPDSALALLTLDGSFRDPVTGVTRLQLGFGAYVEGTNRPQFPFGENSRIELPVPGSATDFYTLPLDNYTTLDRSRYLFGITPSSRFADIGLDGDIRFRAEIGERVASQGLGSQLYQNPDAPIASAPVQMTFSDGSEISMEPGYLWQGYISPNAEQGMNLQITRSALAGDNLAPEAYLRVHPTDTLLNFWGSGQERAEGLDSRSIARRAPVDTDGIEFGTNFHILEAVPAFHPTLNASLGDLSVDANARLQSRRWFLPGSFDNVRNTRRGTFDPFVRSAIWPHGWVSRLTGGRTQAPVRVRVRNAATGAVIEEDIAATWQPRHPVSPQYVATPGAAPIIANPDYSGDDNDVCQGCIVWGGNNAAPFLVPDQAYIDDYRDIWAHRLMVSETRDGVFESDAILSFTLDGIVYQGTLNMPAFQLRSSALRYSPAWEYDTKSADVTAITVAATDPSYNINCQQVRIPGGLLGHFGDTLNCPAASNRAPSFSSRVRRNPIWAGIYGGANVNVILTDNIPPVGLADVNFNIDNIPRPRTRGTGSEVRNVVNDPDAYNPAAGTESYDNDPPASYTTPGERILSSVVMNRTPSAFAQRTRATFAATLTVDAPVLGDMVFYMDRAYNTEVPLHAPLAGGNSVRVGIPRQTLILGANFRISGPGALVPHFGAHNRDAVADVYAARSRFFYPIFANDPDRTPNGVMDDEQFKLHRVYSMENFECAAGPGVAGTPATCPRLYNPDNVPFWIPIISGVMAFEGLEMSPIINPTVTSNIFLAVPQPQAVVNDSGNNRVLPGGSIIDPINYTALSASPVTSRVRLVNYGEASAAVDVSPVNAPLPVRHIRHGGLMRSWDLNLAPQVATAADGSSNVIVELLRFDQDELFDFTSPEIFAVGNLASPLVPRSCEITFQATADDPFAIRNVGGTDIGCRQAGWGRQIPRGQNPFGITFDPSTWNQIPAGRPIVPMPVNVSITVRYDGTLTRGFLVNEQMGTLIAEYNTGRRDFFGQTHRGFATYFPRRGYRATDDTGVEISVTTVVGFGGFMAGAPLTIQRSVAETGGRVREIDRDDPTTTTQRYGYLGPDGTSETSYNFPIGNEIAPFGNPLSWHWISRRTDNFIPLGAGRQFAVREYYARNPGSNAPEDRLFNDVPRIGDQWGCAYENPHVGVAVVAPEQQVWFPQYPTSHTGRGTGNFFGALPCVGDERGRDDFDNGINPLTSHYWVGVTYGSTETDPVPVLPDPAAPEQDDDEFLALRLPHIITIPDQSTMDIFMHSEAMKYPLSADDFFTFPDGSIARIMQVDAASWESVHPFVSRYLGGAEFSNDGGIYPALLSVGADAGADANRVRRLLNSAETMQLPVNNDGERIVDVSGRRVMHYARTESLPGEYTYSNTGAYTNVWIRLPRGGHFEDFTGSVVLNLPPNSIVNPVLGTYLPPEDASSASGTGNQRPFSGVVSDYQAYGDFLPQSEIVVARPAVIIPEGATVHVGNRGARISNVKAAAIFSLRPLEGVECTSGPLDSDFFLQAGLTVFLDGIHQEREGVTENQFPGTDGGNFSFTLGNPCAWADDSENTDGDRTFVYRSRRRYLGEHRARIVSNDRTYLLGGQLRLL